MYGKKEVKEYLKNHEISHEWIDHEAVFTIDEVLALGLENPECVVKNLFLRDQKGKRHFLVLVVGERRVELAKLGEMLGAGKLSFASEERLQKYLSVPKGSVTPFGLLNDLNHEVEVVMDDGLLQFDAIGVHPNDNTATIILSCDDLIGVIKRQGNPFKIVSFS